MSVFVPFLTADFAVFLVSLIFFCIFMEVNKHAKSDLFEVVTTLLFFTGLASLVTGLTTAFYIVASLVLP